MAAMYGTLLSHTRKRLCMSTEVYAHMWIFDPELENCVISSPDVS